MANPAQLCEPIHSLFHTYEDKFILTPNYHVFEMYMAHAGATALRTEFIAPKVSFTRLDAQRKEVTAGLWGLNGSASLKDKQLVLTVVNPHHNQARETENRNSGSIDKSRREPHAHGQRSARAKQFANPHALEPKNAPVSASGSSLVYQFAPASVTRLTFTLS